jgi:hypothetical protein
MNNRQADAFFQLVGAWNRRDIDRKPWRVRHTRSTDSRLNIERARIDRRNPLSVPR